ncbi:DUF499 domain-containing protein [Thioalkalivibrio sp. HK1]|uniref:DUF499 domain-containing protein n=1 Tax=Thioalkalivibrio sp. HK1 TaxID=1469245 RepID=UPI0004700D0E|nr:DUF499 domain-containing protein [Thioalkalivibrio sp. HK1]
MAITHSERVSKALDLLKEGLAPFVEREIKSAINSGRVEGHDFQEYLNDPMLADKPMAQWDVSALLKVLLDKWKEVFNIILGSADRTLVFEIKAIRNRWAHQEKFSSDDVYRTLDSIGRLLAAVSAPQSEEIERAKQEVLRIRFEEQTRGERRKQGALIESADVANLKPWREVVNPHPDVAGGRYQQAEFAADLWQVHLGEGNDEYRDPCEFFRRTYLTESLKRLMTGALHRLSGKGGDPVIQLQTNFGGGKTHSILALYHLFSGADATQLAGIDTIMQQAQVDRIPDARRVVLVGNKISPGNPVVKEDGTRVSTLWGELAWQLGGKEAYEAIAADDEKATNPGDRLRELFNRYGPCIILIDEWVAYARQLHDQSDLPAGSFETQFSFAQALTESAKLSANCLLVISLPASDNAGDSPHTRADDVEVGGQRGREALDRLRNVIGRLESPWRPASAEEGFEIVRRRLFEPFSDPGQYKDRDVTARVFAEFYRSKHQEFPPECKESDYEKRIKDAYPIHPEIFDRLYSDWSTLLKFQRTRGVLRLMSAVIHGLWDKGDKNPLIMPAHIAIDDSVVQFELTRYLDDHWIPVIEKDVDGSGSLPSRIDSEVSSLGKYSACRRVARTIYLGSAPSAGAAHRGLEDRRVKLGCVLPGEQPTVFGDALRRLAGSATYLYQDGSKYWYSTQPTVTKLAEERAQQLERDDDKTVQELEKRIKSQLLDRGDFARVHILPRSGQDISDEDFDAGLVVLGTNHPYQKGKDKENAAEVAAKAILENRGTSPRIYRNTLVFLAADETRLQDLMQGVRYYLAWKSIVDEKESLDLSAHQMKQAQNRKDEDSSTVDARIPETYQWLLAPVQGDPKAQTIEWEAMRLSGQDKLAVRAAKKLRSGDMLVKRYAGTSLKMELDRVPLWRGDHVSIKQILEDFAKYPYLSRLEKSKVLLDAIEDGVSSLTWERDTFAFADSYDEQAERYRGIRCGQNINLSGSDGGLLVKSDVARRQIDAETRQEELKEASAAQEAKAAGGYETATEHPQDSTADMLGDTLPPSLRPIQPKRFHGTVELDVDRVGRDAARVADEVISHLAGLIDSKVKISLDIEAEFPSGAPEQVVRTVNENGRTLKFTSHQFEEE